MPVTVIPVAVVQMARPPIETIIASILTEVTAIQAALAAIELSISAIKTSIDAPISTIVETVVSAVAPIFPPIPTIIETVLATVAAKFALVLTTIASKFALVLAAVPTGLPLVLATIATRLAAVLSAVDLVAPAVLTDLSGFTPVIPAIRHAISALLAALRLELVPGPALLVGAFTLETLSVDRPVIMLSLARRSRLMTLSASLRPSLRAVVSAVALGAAFLSLLTAFCAVALVILLSGDRGVGGWSGDHAGDGEQSRSENGAGE